MNNKINIIVLSIIYFVLTVLFFGNCGNILIDFSRESYIPFQMNIGDTLGKDIFLIYGPFGYLINFLLYKLYPNINIILIESALISYIIVICFYQILRKYTINPIALLLSILFIVSSVFSDSNFSFTTPYSYSTLWAIFAIYLILFSFLYKKEKLRFVLLGFIFINKVELFALTLLFFIFYDIYYKKFKFQNYLLIIIFPLLFSFTFNIDTFLNNSQYLSKMVNTNALKTLYKGMGSYFEINFFINNLLYLLLYYAVSFFSYLIFKNNKIISITLLATFFFVVDIHNIFHLGLFSAIILTFINHKRIKKKDILLLCFSFILCSKAIFSIDFASYSNFGYCILLFYNFRQLFLLLDKKWVILHLILLIFALILKSGIERIEHPKFPLKTDIGTLNLYRTDYELVSKIENYLNNNLKNSDSMIIVPEGQIINLIHKKPWNFYNSTFTPQDFETFDEKIIINKLKENKTDYIIFYPRDTFEYGAKNICYDYAVDFCSYIIDNYTRVEMYGDKRKALIFKINEK